MTVLDDLKREPFRYDLFAVLRMLERDNPDRPRIGEHAVLPDEIARLSQDPYFAFPASNLAGAEHAGTMLRLKVHFLGQFGPQGALPLAVTEEVYGWLLRNDEAFPRFADLVSSRFLQLFFRAWANARPIAQHDRPQQDRFGVYVGAHMGLGAPELRNIDAVADTRKLAFAGVVSAKAKSASRLTSFLQGLFGIRVEVDEFIGSRLKLDAADATRLGRRNSTLGRDAMVGSAVFSVQDKIRVRVFARDLAQYLDFLPAGAQCEAFIDAVTFYVGDELDWDVELALPTRDVAGTSFDPNIPLHGAAPTRRKPSLGMLGWSAWIAPNWASSEDYRRDARFHPADVPRSDKKKGRPLPA